MHAPSKIRVWAFLMGHETLVKQKAPSRTRKCAVLYWKYCQISSLDFYSASIQHIEKNISPHNARGELRSWNTVFLRSLLKLKEDIPSSLGMFVWSFVWSPVLNWVAFSSLFAPFDSIPTSRYWRWVLLRPRHLSRISEARTGGRAKPERPDRVFSKSSCFRGSV